MQNFLDGSHHIPLASHRFLDAKTISEAERILAGAVEPRRFIPNRRSRKQGIEATRYQLADIQIYGLHFDGPLSITSEQLESVNVLFPIMGKLHLMGQADSPAMVCGQARVDSPGGRVAVEWESASTSLVMRVPKDTLNYYCSKLYDIDAYRDIQFVPTLDLSRDGGVSLYNILNTVLMEANNAGSLLNQGVLTKQFQEMLVTTLLNAQPNSLTEFLHERDQQVRPFYIKRAVEYIHEKSAEPITPSDLVEATGVSMRTLQAGFSKYYNLGPSAYIKQLKMRKVRDALQVSNHLETTVAEIAANWGFYNPCNFTVNYKKLFGETPFETLQQPSSI